MNSNSIKPLLSMLVLFMLTGSSLAQVVDSRPKSILDYYLLLPHKYLNYLKADSRSVREAALKIKDVDGGFLKSGQAADEVSTSLALFKKSDGSDVIAVENRSCPSGCSSSLNLLSYANDQWTDVTKDLLPAIEESKIRALLRQQYTNAPVEQIRQPRLIHTLRKDGRSIEVNEHWTGMVLGEFEWANDAFIFRSGDASGSNHRVLAETENPKGDRLQIIGIDPESPASLPLDGHLRIRIAYQIKSAKQAFIWATPVILEQRLPDSFTSGSMPYKPGAGVTTAYLGFNNQAHLDLLRVTMVDEQRKTILTLTYPVDANWTGRRDCPKFRISCHPNIDSSLGALACMVYPSGVLPGQEFTYQWNVSTGSIASGQGTRRIIINLMGAEPETIKADLEIGKLPPTCERKASFNGPIRWRQ